MKELGFELDQITRYFLDHGSIQNNIESFIGTVEIPLGIVGPLLFQSADGYEYVYTAAGTLEGALVASMNRGAKAISLSGGFTAKVHHQKMVRAPLFMLANSEDALIFDQWVKENFSPIKEVAERYSNHARLINISTFVIEQNVHVRFVYTTADASGQNMTTTCTWHAMLWITDNFKKETGIDIPYFVIEGNGSSDKKASRFMIDHGRGMHVTAECFLEESVIHKVLRTSSEDIFRCFAPSVQLAKLDGMLGFNINVANAIAAIFVATGQDLASIHESSVAILNLEKKSNGLKIHLTLPSLVIGTVGGGTNLEKQHEGLKLLGCAGSGKIERFAHLIAGFALSLEISTYSAIVSGEFAKAHEKLGRNKPNKWLLKSDLTSAFINDCLAGHIKGKPISKIEIKGDLTLDNGILTSITQRVNRKLTGFIPLKATLSEDHSEKHLLIKSKPLDIEVIKGLHMMAASIDPKLSDLLYEFRKNLEYWNSHKKELNLYEFLDNQNVEDIPDYYGKYIHDEREIYLLFQEFLDKNEILLMDSENSPDAWTDERTKLAINKISTLHHKFSQAENSIELIGVARFEPWKSKPLYKKMIEIIQSQDDHEVFRNLSVFMEELESDFLGLHIPLTIVHNDYNPRNVAIRKDGRLCIYDWELAVVNIPHRDIVEFLCFSLPLEFDSQTFMDLLKYHFEISQNARPNLSWNEWRKGYPYALKEFLVTRAAFYTVSEILMKLKFGDRIIFNGLRMLRILSNENVP